MKAIIALHFSTASAAAKVTQAVITATRNYEPRILVPGKQITTVKGQTAEQRTAAIQKATQERKEAIAKLGFKLGTEAKVKAINGGNSTGYEVYLTIENANDKAFAAKEANRIAGDINARIEKGLVGVYGAYADIISVKPDADADKEFDALAKEAEVLKLDEESNKTLTAEEEAAKAKAEADAKAAKEAEEAAAKAAAAAAAAKGDE